MFRGCIKGRNRKAEERANIMEEKKEKEHKNSSSPVCLRLLKSLQCYCNELTCYIFIFHNMEFTSITSLTLSK